MGQISLIPAILFCHQIGIPASAWEKMPIAYRVTGVTTIRRKQDGYNDPLDPAIYFSASKLYPDFWWKNSIVTRWWCTNEDEKRMVGSLVWIPAITFSKPMLTIAQSGRLFCGRIVMVIGVNNEKKIEDGAISQGFLLILVLEHADSGVLPDTVERIWIVTVMVVTTGRR